MSTTRAKQTTSYAQAKLARRHHEHAILQDALRRGIPYHQIPAILATAWEQMKPLHADPQQHPRHGHTTRPLDDSFLRRTYKRRACAWVAPAFHSGVGAVAGNGYRYGYGQKQRQGQWPQQQIYFHHWVPGESDCRRKRRGRWK